MEEICVSVPVPDRKEALAGSGQMHVVETEAKFWVIDAESLKGELVRQGFVAGRCSNQRDEYFDFADRRLEALDFVIRVRKEDEQCFVSLKGPRFYTKDNDYSRIELEFEARNENSLREDMRRRNLGVTWYFEKRRTNYTRQGSPVTVVIDEIPEVGFFAEIEGPLLESRTIHKKLMGFLGSKERRNYKEVYIEFKKPQGLSVSDIQGASFQQ